MKQQAILCPHCGYNLLVNVFDGHTIESIYQEQEGVKLGYEPKGIDKNEGSGTIKCPNTFCKRVFGYTTVRIIDG